MFTTMIFAAILSLNAQPAEDFEKHKADALAKIEEHRACVNAATNMDALRGCRKDLRLDRMEHRRDRMNKRIDKMKETKAQ